MKIVFGLMTLILFGCVAGGGGSSFTVADKIVPGDAINVDVSVYEYGNSNVHKSIAPVIFKYKINSGEFIDISAKLDIKTVENNSYYKVDIFTNAKDVKVGDIIYTELSYNWHGKNEIRSGVTRVVESK